MLNNLIGGLEYSWQYILKFDTQIIPFLNNEQISKIANLLLIQMTCNADSFSEWIEVLCKDSLQENRRLVLSVSNCVFIQIGQLVTGVTKFISEYFHTVSVNLLLTAKGASTVQNYSNDLTIFIFIFCRNSYLKQK